MGAILAALLFIAEPRILTMVMTEGVLILVIHMLVAGELGKRAGQTEV
jgi:uncharacterized membrane protein